MKYIIWLWILFLAAIFLYTFNLGELPLRDWDEGIVATVAREIYRAELRDYIWLYPQIDGSPYWNKPPLMHNLIALSYQFFGVSEWSTRLFPSIVSALCVPLLYTIGREVFANKKTALLSAVVYLTLIPVVRHNRLAMLDGAVTFEFCLATWCLLKLQNSSFYQKLYIFGIGIGLGLLCLTKGIAIAFLLSFIILLFIIAEITSFLPLFSWQTIFIVILGVSPAIVWYGLQYAHYGREFINYNLGTQTFNRVINTVENNSQPIWYYILELVKYSFPWLIFLPGGIKLAIKQWNKTWAKLALIWFGSYLTAISLMTTKLPWYIIPLYPAFALLVGANLERIFERKKKNIYKILLFLLSVIFWLASIYFAFFSKPRDTNLFLIAVILAITFTFSTILINRQSNYFIISLSVGLYIALLTFLNTPHAIWELAEAYPVQPVAKLVRENTPPKTTIYTSYPYYRPSLNFYSDRFIIPISEVNLSQILSSNKETYLLLSKDAPNIPNSRTIDETEAWRIAVIN